MYMRVNGEMGRVSMYEQKKQRKVLCRMRMRMFSHPKLEIAVALQ
jgi:hypothetical protein